jgi:hypothetical protein
MGACPVGSWEALVVEFERTIELGRVVGRVGERWLAMPLLGEGHGLSASRVVILHRRTEANTKHGDVIEALVRRHSYPPGSPGKRPGEGE